ncbi:MAG: deoxyguanosinetriphosphate triphosphohydrolase [Alphaproteobacteria bacterium]
MSNKFRPGLALQPFATDASRSRGRLHAEDESRMRSHFQRDRDRIIHSAGFRRLKHKTQVFVYHVGDHYRTRLTHSLEVAQIARTVSRALGLDEDLAEAVSLAHDLGHTPFGHAGESALNSRMAPFGGFDHNEQGLRLVTRLEQRYAEFDGLNLTWETLEGLVKHNGPLGGASGGRIPPYIAAYCRRHDLELATHAGPEAQVAALADDIAYNNHDIDDGLRAGLFAVDDLMDVPLVGPVFAEVRRRYPGIDQRRLKHEAIRRLIDRMVSDLLAETERRLAEAAPESVEEVRHLGHPVVDFSREMRENDRALKTFLFERMYRHEKVREMAEMAARAVEQLFDRLMVRPQELPPEWRQAAGPAGSAETARVVADYLAGMTDRYALRLSGIEPEKIYD